MMPFNIYWANLNPTVSREQAGHRPVLVIPITSRKKGRKIYPNEVLITLNAKEAILLCHQIKTISKARIDGKIDVLDNGLKKKVIDVLCMRFG
jgi:mRNA interferase MazF